MTAVAVATKIYTANGSVYIFDGQGKVLRTNRGHIMRRDDDWIRGETLGDGPVVGEEMHLWLEPLGEGSGTYRRTSRVERIDYDS